MVNCSKRIQKIISAINFSKDYLSNLSHMCTQLSIMLSSDVKLFYPNGTIICQNDNTDFPCSLSHIAHSQQIIDPKYLKTFLAQSEDIFVYDEPCPYTVSVDMRTHSCISNHHYFASLHAKMHEEHLAGMLISRCTNPFTNDELDLLYITSLLLSMSISNHNEVQRTQNDFALSCSRLAVDFLSYAELRAVDITLDSIDGISGTLFLTNIAKQSYITVSLLSSALKKIESAGVIRSRSMGVKGKYITLLNQYLRDDVKKALKRDNIDHIHSLND